MKLRIEQDTAPLNPREEFDHLGKMVCAHRRYGLGDKHDYNADHYDGWDEFEAAIRKEENVVVMLPIFMYDHSGVTINVHGFSCNFDSGQIGFIYATREDVLREYDKKRISKKMREKIEKQLEAEVSEYRQYLEGDVWGYIIENVDGEEVDSCWGFYGHDDCEEEAKSVIKSLEEQDLADAALVAKRFGGAGASGPGCQA